MKVLKWGMCLAITTLLLLFPFGKSAVASAEEKARIYAYVDLGSEVYFFSEKSDKSALFMIPQTYCVEILGKEDDWYYVKYAEDEGAYRAVYGYCRQSEVIIAEQPLENLYLNMTVAVVYTTDEANALLPGLENLQISAAYYGAYTIGVTACSYVYCNDGFGYIPKVVESYPLNELPAKPTIAPAEENGSNATLITALVITGVAASAIAVLYFTGKKNPRFLNGNSQ